MSAKLIEYGLLRSETNWIQGFVQGSVTKDVVKTKLFIYSDHQIGVMITKYPVRIIIQVLFARPELGRFGMIDWNAIPMTSQDFQMALAQNRQVTLRCS